MQRRQLILMGLTLVVGLTAGLIAWNRLHTITREGDPVRYFRREGERAYRRFQTIPATDAAGIDHLIASIPAQDPEHRLVNDPASVESLRKTVSKFLAVRFAAKEPADYYDWMIGRGYRFKTEQEYDEDYGSWDGYQQRAGVAEDNARTIAQAVWVHPRAKNARVEAVCMGSDAALIQIGYATKYRHLVGEYNFGSLGFELWHGASATTCTMWLRPPPSRDDLALEFGQITVAKVSVIVRTVNNVHYPMKVHLFLDPTSSLWWIDVVTISNGYRIPDSWMCLGY